jgi:Transposase DNA-binding
VEKSTPEDLSWIDGELARSKFRDERLGQRLRKIVAQLDGAMGEPIPLACADWANTKAAYRFLSNEDVSEGEILAGHFASTGDRIRAAGGPILVVQDTTEFVYKRARPEEIGSLTYAPNKRNRDRLLTLHTVCGLLMHSSLAITTEGLPLGLVAIKFWTRSKFKGTTALKRRINPTRVPIEGKESMRWLANMRQSSELIGDPDRCIHIGDRENDIYEFFCAAQEIGTNFLVRACVDRLAGEGDHTITDEMAEVTVQAHHTVEIRTKTGEVEQATVEIRYKRICVLPPVGKQKRYPALVLTVIHAEERKHPPHRAPVVWKLITNLEVNSAEEAIEKLSWYALRWKIEVFPTSSNRDARRRMPSSGPPSASSTSSRSSAF